MVKRGHILRWEEKAPLPKGYLLCNGKNKTPDLRKDFVKNYYVYIMKT